MKKNKLTTALTVFGLFCVNLLLAQTTVSGSISDVETNDPIPGVNIIVQGTNDGTNSDFDGNFSFTTDQAVPFTIEVSSIGFGSQSIEVTSADQVLSIALSPGENLDEIVVSASRRPQKVQDAPASVSIISAKDLENSIAEVDPMRNLVNIPGIQLQQTSANSLNIEMRAGSGLFGTSTFPILDYRYLVTPSAGSFLSYQSGISNIDLAKIEVVRGGASALYGPGVTSGVVHFMSKNPIDYPGTTIELIAGDLKTRGISLRHAKASANKKFGYKINVNYKSGDDFTLDPVRDANFISTLSSTVHNPLIVNNQVANGQVGSQLKTESDLDPDGDGNPMQADYENISANAHLEFRPNDKTSAFLSSGWSQGSGLFFNSLGPGRAGGNDYWTQFRVQSGGFFGQVYYNYNDGGDESMPTFTYTTGLRQVAKRSNLEVQLQYNFDVPSFLDTNFTVGVDNRDVKSDSEYTLYGKYDDDDSYMISGAYLQGTSKLAEKLDLTYALRYDKFNFMDEGGFAPRVALVYKASPKSTFRASYNVSTTGPSALQQYIDFPLLTLPGSVMDLWLSGQERSQVISDNIDLTIPGAPNIDAASPGLPLNIPYGAVAGDALAGYLGQVQALGPDYAAAVSSFIGNPANAPTGTTGTLAPYNLFASLGALLAGSSDLTPWDQESAGTGSAEIGYVNQFEIGYKGIIGDKLSVSVDVYTYERQGFTRYTSVAPTYALVGSDVGGDLDDAISASFETHLTGLVASDPAIAQAMLGAAGAGVAAAMGVPFSPALFADPTFLAAAQGAIPAAITGAADGLGTAFNMGGQGFDALAGQLYGIIGAQENTESPDDAPVHSAVGYRRFGNAKRSHWGSDIALEYFASDKLTFFANASWLSQTEWIPGESDDDDLPFASYLQAPKFKYRAGLTYKQGETGWYGNLSFQHDDAFYNDEGVFAGMSDEKNLVDAGIGYTLNNGIKLNLSASNLFDQKYRAFPNMPIIGRRILLKTVIDF